HRVGWTLLTLLAAGQAHIGLVATGPLHGFHVIHAFEVEAFGGRHRVGQRARGLLAHVAGRAQGAGAGEGKAQQGKPGQTGHGGSPSSRCWCFEPNAAAKFGVTAGRAWVRPALPLRSPAVLTPGSAPVVPATRSRGAAAGCSHRNGPSGSNGAFIRTHQRRPFAHYEWRTLS